MDSLSLLDYGYIHIYYYMYLFNTLKVTLGQAAGIEQQSPRRRLNVVYMYMENSYVYIIYVFIISLLL